LRRRGPLLEEKRRRNKVEERKKNKIRKKKEKKMRYQSQRAHRAAEFSSGGSKKRISCSHE
jgi:hypothetical protein